MTFAEEFEEFCAHRKIDEDDAAWVLFEEWLDQPSEPDPLGYFDSRSEERLDALDRMDSQQ